MLQWTSLALRFFLLYADAERGSGKQSTIFVQQPTEPQDGTDLNSKGLLIGEKDEMPI